jgi:hypothetical protein
MKMLGHHHISDYDKTVSLPHLFEHSEEQVTSASRSQKRLAVITTAGDEVQVSCAVVPLQSPGHEAMLGGVSARSL